MDQTSRWSPDLQCEENSRRTFSQSSSADRQWAGLQRLRCDSENSSALLKCVQLTDQWSLWCWCFTASNLAFVIISNVCCYSEFVFKCFLDHFCSGEVNLCYCFRLNLTAKSLHISLQANFIINKLKSKYFII